MLACNYPDVCVHVHHEYFLKEEENAHWLFQYGPEVGDRKFLETLASFLTEEYKSPVDP